MNGKGDKNRTFNYSAYWNCPLWDKKPKPINVMSLFDGLSCGRIALERAGIKVSKYYASEIDKNAIKVAQHNYPDTIQVGDVCQLQGEDFKDIDLILAGSPCTGFSAAGKGLNFTDPQSKLFFQFVRLLQEIQPKYFLLENVSMKKEYEDKISEYLGCSPVVLNSSLVSGAMRKRLYWSNIPITQPKDKGILLKDIIDDGVVDKDKAYCIDASYIRNSNPFGYMKKSRGTLIFDTVENLKRFRGMTRAELLSEEVINETCYRRLNRRELERCQTLPEGYTDCIPYEKAAHAIGNGWTVDVIVGILKSLNTNV